MTLITNATIGSSNMTPVRKTGGNKIISHYTEILARAKDEGLLEKTPSFYIKRLAVITALSLTLWAGLIVSALLLPFWGAVIVCAPIMLLHGVLAAQYAFIAHETSHRQVFRSNKLNDNVGRILANLLAGLSYGFWMRKHNRHHAKPNQIGADPDINIRVLSFTTESLEEKKGPEKILSKNQGWLFPFLLLFTSFDLLLDSIVSITSKEKKVEHRFLEFGMMVVRQVTPFVVVLILFQNIFIAFGLWMIMMMAFGFFMGAAFAPNHKGMPMIERDAKIDFFQRQVLTSRNIRSTWLTDNLMGGLNFQVEHHLFPSMARPHLKRAHQLVLEYCKEKEVPFVEMGIIESYGVIIRYLNKVGLSNNRDPFVCPMIAELRPRN
jgi:fatty acid desaturase